MKNRKKLYVMLSVAAAASLVTVAASSGQIATSVKPWHRVPHIRQWVPVAGRPGIMALGGTGWTYSPLTLGAASHPRITPNKAVANAAASLPASITHVGETPSSVALVSGSYRLPGAAGTPNLTAGARPIYVVNFPSSQPVLFGSSAYTPAPSDSSNPQMACSFTAIIDANTGVVLGELQTCES